MWLYNVSWKRPPDFGEDSGTGVYGFTEDAVEYPVFPPFSWLAENLILPNFTPFGWAVLIVETALAVLLLTGAFVRLAALVGIGQALAIGLSVAQTPGEWPWAYWLMIGVHVLLLFSAAGKVLAVDAVRGRSTGDDRTMLALAWGGVVTVAALVAVVGSLGDDPLTTSGAALGGPGLSISLGNYNVVGAVALLVAGGALLAAALTRQATLALLATVVGVVSAATLYAQLGFSGPWLGGTNTSAAFFLCAATIGWVIARTGDASAVDPVPPTRDSAPR